MVNPPLKSAILNSLIAVIPVVGGASQTALSSYLSEVRAQRWDRFLESLADRLSILESQAAAPSEALLQDLLQRMLALHASILSESDQTKLKYLRNYLVNCVSEQSPDVTWKDMFLLYLQRCTGAHLSILSSFFTIQRNLSEIDRFDLPQRTDMAPVTVSHLRNAGAKAFDSALVDALISDLESFGLLRLWGGDSLPPRGWSVTANGILFLKFISNSEELEQK